MVRLGDKVLINVPMEVKWEVKEFEVVELYTYHALLSDGIINVDYTLWDLEHCPQPIKGCWA